MAPHTTHVRLPAVLCGPVGQPQCPWQSGRDRAAQSADSRTCRSGRGPLRAWKGPKACVECGRQHVWADRPWRWARKGTKHPGKTHLGVSSLQRGPSHRPDPARWGSACEKPRQTRGQAAVCWERPQPHTLQDGGWSQNVTQTPGNRTQALCPQRTIPWRGTVGGSPRGGPRPRGFRSLLVHRKLSFPTAVCHRILPCDSPGCRPHPLSSSRTQGGKWCPVIYGRTQRNDPQGTGL